ncbi:hypothetical protein M434DRAFT_356864 [Hypoxylon sp. CO27-5]|nr:hypothetical protein M434DRAFT_356864 [Hypoxylon sp. CO27-5]
MEQRGDDVLKISDFGLTRWHREVSSNQTDGVGVFVSRTYRAPEYDLKISPSQSWDIWNLACLYLDLLTWYLLGWEKGVDEFSRQRAAESSSSIREDNYFNMEPATGSEFGASLKQCVMTWINRLHATEGCSLFIHDFLDIIQDGMLLIHHDKRLGSKEIHHRLANLYDICRENKVYCFESVHESHQSLGVLLRTNLIKHCWGRHEDFLTLGSLRNLLQPTEIGRHLQQFYKSAVSAGYQPQGPNIGIYLKLICPNDRSMDNSVTVRNKTYIRLFAILVLIDKGVDVFKFIDNGLSDEALPIDTTNNTFQSSIGEWRQLHLDSFDTWQWRMNVPFLSYGKHRVFGSQVVLPFVEGSISTANNPDSGRLGPIVETGGYGEVSCVEIHADCHDFRGVFGQLPKPEGPFALKKIIGTSPVTIEDNFKREARMLKKFNGDVHPHIISVLSTFKHGDYYYLLFPWAECDLQKYFKVNPNPTPSLETVRWLSQQCLRIVEAVHLIHSPPGQDNLQPEDRVVGRHGDIKAENVLVFRSQEGKANLVLSDFGLGSLHHDMSKSNIPNKTIPVTPGLRPPECDMKGGYISSAFDIWTLGCLFLDLLTWLLGGEELRLRFEEERMTPYINGLETPIYFDIVRTEDGQPAYIVKEQVKRWFAELHRNDHCTQFVHDFLDLIERKMLIVETDVKKRARTNELLQRLQTFHSLCHGQDAQAYCVRAAPDQTRLIVPTTIAKGPLNETVEDNIRRSRITLRKVAGRAQRAEQAED